MKIAYYGVGGGTGHLVRGISILRKFIGDKKVLITSSKFYSYFKTEDIEIFKIPEKNLNFRKISSGIRKFLNNFSPDILFVDTFPEGCFGELIEIPFRKIFINRSNCFSKNFWMEFDLENFPPILIRDFEELKSRDSLRYMFGIKDSEKLLFFFHNTSKDEVDFWVSRISDISDYFGFKFLYSSGFRVCKDNIGGENISYFPVMEILPMADIVISGAGYNSYCEVSTLFDSAIFIPFRRKIDNQKKRIESERFFVVDDPLSLKNVIEKNLHRFHLKSDYYYENGANYIYEEVMKNFSGE